MSFEIVLTTAEDIVAVVDAVYAKPKDCMMDFICEFADLSQSQAQNALHMAKELSLINCDDSLSIYTESSYLARLIISSRDDVQKASIMRLILEQYEPYITFKSRFIFTGSVETASRHVKTLYSMQSQHRDIKNTIISMATYSKSMIDEGANTYKLNHDASSYINILDKALYDKSSDENLLMNQLGKNLYDILNKETVFKPLSDAYSKLQATPIDGKAIILYAANAFESFLGQIADDKGISLVGKDGIISKGNALSLSKKHKGMIEYLGQIRNATDHGSDSNEGGKIWNVCDETAKIYPFIVTNLMKSIIKRDSGDLVV